MLKFFVFLFLSFFMTSPLKAELIVLASPSGTDGYYNEMEDQIFDFHVSYAKQIVKHDQVIVLTDEKRYADYVSELGADKVLNVPMLDIWMRDFTLSNVTDPIMFRYAAAAQDNQETADLVQEEFASLLVEAGLQFKESDLINDGGNFVDDYTGNVVVSKKFLKDNGLSEEQARKILTDLPSIENVAFIEADEQGGLEHADGVVSFVAENTLIVNSYSEDPEYSAQLKAELKRGLPNVVLHEIVTPYDGSQVYDERFGSACGLYTNALVTPERIYFPQFGIPEDEIALKQVRAVTDREIIPVQSHPVCQMGGGVRCMSWQLRGNNAQKFLRLLN